jgi:hypothetical protein
MGANLTSKIEKLDSNVSKKVQYTKLENIVTTGTCAMHAGILSTNSNNAIQMLQPM